MASMKFTEMFPTRMSFVVFVSYIAVCLFLNQALLVTASQNSSNSYSYNTVTVVLLTEMLKLVVSVMIYWKNNPLESLFVEIRSNMKVFSLYFIPALLYCFYNNLAFVNLSNFDPTTYYLLLQFRVVITGIVFQVVFKKKLSRIQWLSLVLLTIGCMVKEAHVTAKPSSIEQNKAGGTSSSLSPASKESFHLGVSILLILFQTFLSSMAGVYNEYLLKGEGSGVGLVVQNVCMYADSIICNLALLLITGSSLEPLYWDSLMQILKKPIVMTIVASNAVLGLVTSWFLRSLNSILKTFASALELLFTAVLSWIFFGIPLQLNTLTAIFIVYLATFLYSQNPVINLPKDVSQTSQAQLQSSIAVQVKEEKTKAASPSV